MSDSRSRFEAWWRKHWDDASEEMEWQEDRGCYEDFRVHIAFKAWQAAEQETVRRCAELAGYVAMEYRAKYKGMTVDGVRQIGTYHPHDDGMSDGAAVVEDAIRTEFSEAFK